MHTYSRRKHEQVFATRLDLLSSPPRSCCHIFTIIIVIAEAVFTADDCLWLDSRQPAALFFFFFFRNLCNLRNEPRTLPIPRNVDVTWRDAMVRELNRPSSPTSMDEPKFSKFKLQSNVEQGELRIIHLVSSSSLSAATTVRHLSC